MANKTQNELVKRALQSLNRVSANGTPNAADNEKALEIYTSEHEALLSRLQDRYRIFASWDKNSIPEEYFAFVVKIMAAKFIGEFRVSDSMKMEKVGLSEEAEIDLGQLLAKRKRTAKRFPDFPFGRSTYYNVNTG